MIVNRTPSGDWVAKAEREDLDSREDILICLLWAMEDCTLCGDEYCLSNWDMAVDLYDHYTGKTIRIPFSDADKLQNGNKVTFYARETEFSDGDKVEHYLYDNPATIIHTEGNLYTLQFEDGMVLKANRDEIAPYFN